MIRLVSAYPRAIAATLACAVAAALFIGGAQPFAVNLIPSPWDKFAHVVAFAAFGVTVGISVGVHTRHAMFFALAATLVVGGIDELHQGILPGRHAGWDDFAADAIGALCAALIVRILRAFVTGETPPG